MLLDTPICDFGWIAPDFTLSDPHGIPFTLSEQLGCKGLLVIFLCNHCPYVQRIASRLAQDAHQLMGEGISVVAVMSNDYREYPEDAPDRMVAFARQHDFPFLYLVDEDQSVGKAFGAVCTPDFFGFNARGELQYRGRLDDACQGGEAERTPELLNAMRMIAETGRGPREQHPSMGCSIKWRT
ncbi:thioredoxin family protein [Ferrimonas sediminicola]|uniref:Thioredoxin family protein n=1 Tax=Ferrimonas sediminicola TaxID=2569538 RepID=A0A4U1BBW1_9GAMM|nr:thioredoxin family protein [Ferrimonas sediminicola]TKB48422.1 thioredoxin family protein [Ferrimonas sediminicola]